MKYFLSIAAIVTTLVFASCESSEDISNGFDHQVPACKQVTLIAGAQNQVIDDQIVTAYFWGFVPQANLETLVLPTVSVPKGDTLRVRVNISDNSALRSLTLSYSPWMYTKYINFANPEAGIPLTPQNYTLQVDIPVPVTAITASWLENYYFNDGSSMKIVSAYHKMELTVTDIYMNKRIVPIFVKVQ